MTVQEWLGQYEIGIDIYNGKYKFKNETHEQWLDRVSGGDQELRKLIAALKFLFGGRALTNRGIDDNGSLFNCYSAGFVPDDYDQILDINKIIGLTYKSQGGQGVSLSKLRPKGSPVGKRYKSDGIVPFMEIYNTTTKETSQGGSRKGALMISLDIRHKEAETFIKIKSENGRIEKANLSLEIDDEFMNAVNEYYKTGEVIKLQEHRNYSGHIVEYEIIPIELYKQLVQNCYEWADPACLFTNRFRNYNLMELDDEYQIETCNPCGEQPLPQHFCCNLGSMNLAEYILNSFTNKAEFDYKSFINDIPIAIRALDVLIDENANHHPISLQKENSLNYRNIGLGVMGYANALMKLGIKYGSQESKEFTDTLFKTLLKTAVLASVNLAKEKGSFPKYKKCLFDSTILKNVFSQEELDDFKQCGIRNCSLVSIAPTGSIGTMLGRSGGCEPEYAIKYTRKTESLNNGEEKYYDIYCKTATEYMALTNESTLPDYFISSQDIYWKDRVDIQAIMQKYVDTAISSTVNLPNNTPIEDVEKLYLYAWEKGLKGITIYRDGCKRSGILTTDSTSQCSDIKYNTIAPMSRKKIGTTHGSTYCKKCACGTLYVTINRDSGGNVIECFVHTSKGGICGANIGAINRMISLAMRSGVKIDEITDQLKGINCSACVKVKTKGEEIDGISCPDILARTIEEFCSQPIEPILPDTSCKVTAINTKQDSEKCPECKADIKHDGGCISCLSCGWSRCE